MALIRTGGAAAAKGHFIIVADDSGVGTKWSASEIIDSVPTYCTGTAAGNSSVTIGNATITGSQGSGGSNDRIYTVTGVTGDIYIPDGSGGLELGATITDASIGNHVEFSTLDHPAMIVIEVK